MLKGNLTCTIVNKLLTYFVEDNLDRKCRNMVIVHLRNCPLCMEKYTLVKKLYNEAEKKRKLIKEREEMREEISEYLDGEMPVNKLSDFERKLSEKPEYEDNLISVMRLKKNLNNSFYKTKYNLETNYTKNIMQRIKERQSLKGRLKSFFSLFAQYQRRFL